MNVLFESRASIILYNFLSMMVKKKPFLLPSNICPIVPAVYLKLKIPFEVVDISLDTLEMDKKIILKKINKAPNKYS